MHSPAQSPILDVTETVSMHSELDAELESKNSPSYSISIPQNLRLTGLGFPGMIGAKRSSESLPAFEYIAPPSHALQALEFPLMELNRVGVIGGGMFPGFVHRRVRGEKRPIPEAQKDAKYFERRKRNNEAAKKSRDARKIREDRIAFRAALLEQENSILRAQVLAMSCKRCASSSEPQQPAACCPWPGRCDLSDKLPGCGGRWKSVHINEGS